MRGQKPPDCDIDLGLAVSALSLEYGQTRTYEELAAYCGCSKSAIQNIEYKALRKVRRAIYCHQHPVFRELMEYRRVSI